MNDLRLYFDSDFSLDDNWGRFVADVNSWGDYVAIVPYLSASVPNPFVLLGNGGGNTLYRLREGIERFLITDINNPARGSKAQSEVPVMMDTLAAPDAYNIDPATFYYLRNMVSGFNHIPGGCNVLYMDGHVRFVRYKEEFPVSVYNGMCPLAAAKILAVPGRLQLNVSNDFRY